MVQFIADIAFYSLGGIPLLAYGGMLTFIFLLITAYVGHKVSKNEAMLSTHKMFVAISFLLALGHALLGILSFL